MRRAAAWGSLLVLPLSAWGCSVPVFSFAMQNWKGSPHALRVGAADLNAAERLLGSGRANLMIVLADDVAQGHAELRFPDDERAWATVALTLTDASAITESPARAEIARQLLAGDAVVWLLLDSGDAGADRRARALLDERLAHLTANAERRQRSSPTPSPITATPDDPPAPVIAFATVEVRANDPAESWLVREIDHLATASSGPRLVPIFGRGRALPPLCGTDLSAQAIDAAASFLCGDCSCQARLANPGRELLLAADWDQGPAQIGPNELPASARPEEVHIVPPVETIALPTRGAADERSVIGHARAGVLALTGVTILSCGLALVAWRRRLGHRQHPERMP